MGQGWEKQGQMGQGVVGWSGEAGSGMLGGVAGRGQMRQCWAGPHGPSWGRGAWSGRAVGNGLLLRELPLPVGVFIESRYPM